MSLEILDKTLQRAAEYFDNNEEGYLSILFQGGEPTLAGLKYFEQVIALQERYFGSKLNVSISNSIQTNACKLKGDLVKFLSEHNFFFGISLDGPQDIHDANRTHLNGQGSYSEVLNGMELLLAHNAQFHVLCVLTDLNALNIDKVYNHFKKLGLYHQQYIACLDPFDRPENQHFLSEQAYQKFLVDIFDLWYHDLMEHHTYFSIRHIENYLALLLGMDINSCNMTGVCQVQNVVESNGNIFPCDFYAHDDYQLGNVTKQSFDSMIKSTRALNFVQKSQALSSSCQTCPYLNLCRNGCMREREQGKNIHCLAFKHFFDQRLSQLKLAAAHLHALNS